MDVLRMLLTMSPEVGAIGSLDAWWEGHARVAARFAAPIDVAFAGGFAADRLGYAFASGYVAAGHALFGAGPSFSPPVGPVRGALCATEERGAHPRHIHTALTKDGAAWRLRGDKRYVTFGAQAERLYVVCSLGQRDDGRNDLRVVAIPPRDGVIITALPETPFVPEIPHASVRFDDVQVAPDEILEGDGYARYLKPFRTIEDIFVHAALLGWLMQVGRRSAWPAAILERMTSSIVAFRSLAVCDPSAPEIHVALGGALAGSAALVEALDWSGVDDVTRARWERDKALLRVAGSAREKRLEAAWLRLASASSIQAQ